MYSPFYPLAAWQTWTVWLPVRRLQLKILSGAPAFFWFLKGDCFTHSKDDIDARPALTCPPMWFGLEPFSNHTTFDCRWKPPGTWSYKRKIWWHKCCSVEMLMWSKAALMLCSFNFDLVFIVIAPTNYANSVSSWCSQKNRLITTYNSVSDK